MRLDKHDAFVLRRTGKSYVEISSILGVSKSTLSNWFKGVDFSEAIKQSLLISSNVASTSRLEKLNKRRGDTLNALYLRAEQEAKHEMVAHVRDPLFVAAIAAYWGEGDKTNKNQVRITNTDPKMIKLFVDFLMRVCLVDKNNIRIALFIYPDLDDVECREFWSKNTGIEAFHKTMVLPSKGGKKRLPYGICTVIVSNSYLKQKILTWIDQLPQYVLR